jgi:hypothetical protein
MPQTRNQRHWTRRLLVGYTAITALLYLPWAPMSGDWSLPLGPVNLLLEIPLIGLLLHEERMRLPRLLSR